MANRYWVGGSGTWDASSTANWSDSSGGASGATAPTLNDNAYFDGSSDSGAPFTVTISTNAVCNNLIIGDGTTVSVLDQTMTLAGTADISVYGSLFFPASNLTLTYNGTYNFLATTTGNTVTTNGVSIPASANKTYYPFTFNGAGGEWTLGSALTIVSNQSFGSGIALAQGTLITNNYNITCRTIFSSYSTTRQLNLGSSSISLEYFGAGAFLNFANSTNMTLNAGTSTISLNNTSGGGTFAGGGLSFYNVQVTNTTTGITFTGANSYNNLTINAVSTTRVSTFSFSGNQTIAGTFTVNSGNTDITRRVFITSDSVATPRTFTAAVISFGSALDFRSIAVAGAASPWDVSALSGGDCGGNTNITFAAPKTVYWNLAGSQNWSATGWATTNNGSPSASNFPLAQDTVTFTEAGAAGTVTVNANWNIGPIQMADGVSNRTTAFTLATGTNTPAIYGDVTLFSNLTISGTGAITFAKQGTTQKLTSAGRTFTQPIIVNCGINTFQPQDNFTNSLALTLTSGTLDANNKNFTIGSFSLGAGTKTLTLGSGTWACGGNWNSNANVAGLTVSASTATINMTSASAKTFSGGGNVWPTLNQGGAGILTIAQSNTFANITDTVQPATVRLTAGTTQTVNALSLAGTSGNLITLETTVAGTRATIYKASGSVSLSFVSIKDIAATGGANFNAFTSNGCVDGGNNTGWDFNSVLYPTIYTVRKTKRYFLN